MCVRTDCIHIGGLGWSTASKPLFIPWLSLWRATVGQIWETDYSNPYNDWPVWHVNKTKKKTKQKTLHEELSTVEDHMQTAGTSRLNFPFRVPRRQSSQWRESRAAKHACYGWNVFEFPFNMLCLLNENVVGFHLQNLCLYVHAFHVHTVDWTCSIR